MDFVGRFDLSKSTHMCLFLHYYIIFFLLKKTAEKKVKVILGHSKSKENLVGFFFCPFFCNLISIRTIIWQVGGRKGNTKHRHTKRERKYLNFVLLFPEGQGCLG